MVLNEQLLTFTVAAEEGSFSKAAMKLFISAPAVIKQMNALEKELGFPVFTRTHQGITLTPSGKILYNEAKLLLSHFQEAVASARRMAAPEEKALRVGTSIFKPFQPFMQLWDQYTASFPGCALQIVPFADDHNTISSTVASLGSRFDFLIAACNSKAWLEQVSFYELWEDPFCAAVPRQHPLAGKKQLAPEDFQGQTLYLFAKGDAPSVDAVWDALETVPNLSVIATSYYDMDLFNRAAGENRIIISIQAWAHVHPSFASLPVSWDLTTPYGLLYAKRPGPQVKKFLRCLEENKKQRP